MKQDSTHMYQFLFLTLKQSRTLEQLSYQLLVYQII